MIRECAVCGAWCGTNDPIEQKVFRDCPYGHGPMKLIMGESEESFRPMSIGKLVALPKPYPAPNP